MTESAKRALEETDNKIFGLKRSHAVLIGAAVFVLAVVVVAAILNVIVNKIETNDDYPHPKRDQQDSSEERIDEGRRGHGGKGADSSSSEAEEGKSAEVSTTVATTTPQPFVYCEEQCQIHVLETIPFGMLFRGRLPESHFEGFRRAFKTAKQEMHIMAYKTNLRGTELPNDPQNFTGQGKELFDIIVDMAARNVNIEFIDCYPPTKNANNLDSLYLGDAGLIERRDFNMGNVNNGHGIHHSKMWMIDKRHIYIGSANLEWKSYSQKLELGLQFENCTCLAHDVEILFNSMWNMDTSKPTTKPKHFAISTIPVRIGPSDVRLFASPVNLLASNETWDLTAIINMIDEAEEFLDIAVMNYYPQWLYGYKNSYYAPIDDAVRQAIFRGVKVRLIVAAEHSSPVQTMFSLIKSLSELNNANANAHVRIRYVTVPQNPEDGILSRRFHSKFMVSEKASFVGTSNFTPDYFFHNSGLGVTVHETGTDRPVAREFRQIFNRYWRSQYALTIEQYRMKFIPDLDMEALENE